MSGLRRVLVEARRRLPLLRDDGQGLLEFAIIAPVLLLILFGIIEFARAWNNKNDVVHLANEAARLAVVDGVPSNCGTSSGDWQVPDDATRAGLPAVPQTSISFSGGATVGSPLTVTISIPFSSPVPIISSIPGFPDHLTGSATMMAERQYTGPASCS